MAPALLDSVHPAADPVLAPLLTRAKALGLVLPRKPASLKQDPVGFVRAQVTAKAFDTVLTARRIANTTIADMWGGVSESVVRGVRSGDKPFTLSKVQQLPPDLREAIDAKTEELLADLRRLAASLPLLTDDLRSGAPAPSNDHHVARPR
jgi:hypothetical protein